MISRKHLLLALVFGLALGAALVALPRLLAASSFFIFQDSLKNLFYGRLGLSAALSDALSLILVFFFPLATYIFFANILAVWSNRADSTRVTKVFVAYGVLYLLPGLAIALNDRFGSMPYFDQETGAPRQFYTIQPGGVIRLSDSPGYDQFGVKRQPVTTEIARVAERQKTGVRLTRVTGDPRNMDFFDATGGGARIYFSRGPDRTFELFDGPGVNPRTNEVLQPITTNVVDELIKEFRLQEQRRLEAEKAAADAEAKRRSEENQRNKVQQEGSENNTRAADLRGTPSLPDLKGRINAGDPRLNDYPVDGDGVPQLPRGCNRFHKYNPYLAKHEFDYAFCR